jgi:hypothetical protein
MGHTVSTGGPILWQHGDNDGFKHIAAARPDRGDAIIVLTNGDSGWAVVRDLAAHVVGLSLW